MGCWAAPQCPPSPQRDEHFQASRLKTDWDVWVSAWCCDTAQWASPWSDTSSEHSAAERGQGMWWMWVHIVQGCFSSGFSLSLYLPFPFFEQTPLIILFTLTMHLCSRVMMDGRSFLPLSCPEMDVPFQAPHCAATCVHLTVEPERT